MPGREQHQNYPSLIDAFFLVAALFALEYVVGAAFRDAARVWGLGNRDFNEIVTLLANGVLFTGVLYYKRLSYSELFHPARHSVAATLGTLSVPILLVVPGLLLRHRTAVLGCWPAGGFDRQGVGADQARQTCPGMRELDPLEADSPL